jgi:hypothetical protein
MHFKSKPLLTLIGALAIGLALVQPAQAGDKTDTSEQAPYVLNLQALKGKTHTDLYIQTVPTGSLQTPTELEKVQLKSYTADGKLAYTRNFNDTIPLTNGQATLVLDDVERTQPLKTKVHIKNDDTTSTEVLEATTKVLLRPDLVIDKVDVAPKVTVNAPFTVHTVLKETNLDVGAKVSVTISNGDTVLDNAEGVVVNAGSQKAVSFLLQLDQPGDYLLTAHISGAEPAEYDTTNNTTTFPVKVVIPTKEMNYYAYYRGSHEVGNFEHYSVGELASTGIATSDFEYFEFSMRTSDLIDPAGSLSFKLQTENGTEVETSFSNVQWKTETYPWGSYKTWAKDGLFLRQDEDGTLIYFIHDGYQTHRSTNWSRWGQPIPPVTEVHFPVYNTPKQYLTAFIDLPDKQGVHYGGSFTLNLSPSQSSYDYWEYHGRWDSIRYFGTKTTYYGRSYGITTWPEQ